MRVRLSGADTGSGTPIVLLHGLASTHRWWDLVARRLPGFRVIRFDHRGHGASDQPKTGYDLAHLAADTLNLLDALRLPRVVLAGHSLGAAVALRLAAEHPSRVAGLACVEGGVYEPGPLFGTHWEQARRVMIRARRGQVTAAVLRAWLETTDLPAEALPAIMANYTTAPDGGLRLRLDPRYEHRLAHDLWRQEPGPLLARIQAPTLVIAARHGHPGPDEPRRVAIDHAEALLGPGLTVRWLVGGHELPLTRPAAVATELIKLAGGRLTEYPPPGGVFVPGPTSKITEGVYAFPHR